MPRKQPYKNFEGKRAVGVTTYGTFWGGNKEVLMRWSRQQGVIEGKDPDALRDKAAAAGTLAHEMMEAHIKELPEPDILGYTQEQVDHAEAGFDAFRAWEEEHSPAWMQSEMRLVVDRVGGTLDGVAGMGDGGIWLVDFKTSKGVYPDMVIQVAAYRWLLSQRAWRDDVEEWWPGIDVAGVMILHCNKETAEFRDVVLSDEALDVGLSSFQCCVRLYEDNKVLTKAVRA